VAAIDAHPFEPHTTPGSSSLAAARRAARALWRHRVLCAIVALGFALRLTWVLMVDEPGPGGEIARGDQYWYYHFARDIAAGRGYVDASTGEPTAYYPIGYPAILAALFWIVAHTPLPNDYILAAQLLNAMVGTVTIVFVYVIARRMFDGLGGLIAAGVVAVFPNLVFQVGGMQLETMFTFWCLAALCVVVTHEWADGPPSPRRLALFGALLGVSVLIRPFSVWFVAGVFAAALIAGQRWRNALTLAAVPLGIVLLMSVPWTIRNAVSLNAFVPTSTNTGDTLCLDRFEGADGRFRWAEHEGCADPNLPEAERSARSTAKAIRFVLADPVRELVQIGRRARLIFASDRDGLEVSRTVGQGPVVAPATERMLSDIADAYFHSVVAVAAAGLIVTLGSRRRRPESSIVVVALGSLVAVPLLLWGAPRFHVPVSPLLAILVGGVVAVGSEWLRRQRPENSRSTPWTNYRREI
jgi:asparagine N-glycosylation enzyme membrane subunit Stt3